MPPPPIPAYIKETARTQSAGEFTEHSFRAALQKLLQALLPGVDITNEPGRIMEGGAPDYVLKRKTIPLGYIEAKNIDKSLDDKSFSGQFSRYLQSLDNLIFTNYLEFRFHCNNESKPVATVAIAELRNGKIKPLPQNFAHFQTLIANFGAYEGQTITSAADLAKRMADKAKLLAQNIADSLTADENDNAVSEEDSELKNQLKAFRETLIKDIRPAEFAGIYAQTVAYGMFAARLHDPTPATFTRHEAAELIPKSNPFLRKLFQHIAGYELDSRIRWIVDDLADIFRASDVPALMEEYGKATQRNDPFLHFYETFLGQYDAKLRKSRGVWYTPEPVVNFIVRAVDWILKKEFALKDGLADGAKITVGGRRLHRVQILDPAAGTGTFLADIVKAVHRSFAGRKGVWPDYARDDLIPRLHGFEILMASYAMAHIKLEMILNDTGCRLRGGQRLQVFLTDSLENRAGESETREIPFANWLVKESKGAEKVKQNMPVMVVMGNPPYAISSSNTGQWIRDLIKVYKKNLEEKKLNLDDDYIKFIRYGEHLIEKTGEGVLAYISNNSFIEGITHRRMRRHLLETFDQIYVLNLHGDTRKKERAPDGSPDKNVFDIMQGVSVSLFVKNGKKEKGALGEVFHFDLFGGRESKYEFLWSHDMDTVDFQKLETPPPYFFFAPKDFSAQAEYENGFAVNLLFEEYNSGIQTKCDDLAVKFSQKELEAVADDFLTMEIEELRAKYPFKKDSSGWNFVAAKNDLMKRAFKFTDMLYRPFDVRGTIYTGTSSGFLGRSRHKTMRHMLDGDNLGFMTSRSYPTDVAFDRVFVTRNIADLHAASDQTYFFPLYLYTEEKQTRLGGEPARKPNLSPDIIQQIAGNIGLRFTPEKTDDAGTFTPLDVLDYIYATLHSPAYREKFREFLKIDFPRVPHPRDKKQFRRLTNLGAELRQLHLMQSEKLDNPTTTYPAPGDNIITTAQFEAGKVWVNKNQHFTGVPETAWQFPIGGYLPAQKWLKDRKGRKLSPQDVVHYQKIIAALVETARVMDEIDGA